MRMVTKSIGIIDSGLGGFTFYHALTNAFPEASFTLIVDQENAPFGEKSKEELLEIGTRILSKMRELSINTVLVACNTLSAVVLKELHEEFDEFTLINVIDLTIDQIEESSNRILVIATSATIKQGTYSKSVSQKLKNAWINELATPKLVPLIEGLAEDKDIDEILSDYLRGKTKVDSIVLGCTHYPLIKKNIQKLTKAKIVDALEGSIDYFKTLDLPQGESKVYTTLDPRRFEHQIKSLFNREVDVEKIDL